MVTSQSFENDGVYESIVGAASNGRKGFGMGRVDFKESAWAGRLQAKWLNAADVQTPDYILGNTASNVEHGIGIAATNG